MNFSKKNNKFSTKQLSSSAIVIVCVSIVCCIGSWLIGSGIYDSISDSVQQVETLNQVPEIPDMIEITKQKVELKEEIFQKKIGLSFCVLIGILSFVSFCSFFPEAFYDVRSYIQYVEPAAVTQTATDVTTCMVTEAGITYFKQFTEVQWELLVDHLATFGTKVPPASYEDMTLLFNNIFKNSISQPVMFKLETMSYILKLSTSENPQVYAKLLSTTHPGAEVFIEFIKSKTI